MDLAVHSHWGTACVAPPHTPSSFSLPPFAARGKCRFQESQIWDWKPSLLAVLNCKRGNPNLKVPAFQRFMGSQVFSLLSSFMTLEYLIGAVRTEVTYDARPKSGVEVG